MFETGQMSEGGDCGPRVSIASWNINGLRAVVQKRKTLKKLLDSLGTGRLKEILRLDGFYFPG